MKNLKIITLTMLLGLFFVETTASSLELFIRPVASEFSTIMTRASSKLVHYSPYRFSPVYSQIRFLHTNTIQRLSIESLAAPECRTIETKDLLAQINKDPSFLSPTSPENYQMFLDVYVKLCDKAKNNCATTASIEAKKPIREIADESHGLLVTIKGKRLLLRDRSMQDYIADRISSLPISANSNEFATLLCISKFQSALSKE